MNEFVIPLEIDKTTVQAQILESNLPMEEKLTQLFILCENTDRYIDHLISESRSFSFTDTLLKKMGERGFKLKIEQNSKGFKATFWKPDGEKVKTYSHTHKDLQQAINYAGNTPNANKIVAMLKQQD